MVVIFSQPTALIITLLGDKSSVCITIVISGVKTKSVKLLLLDRGVDFDKFLPPNAFSPNGDGVNDFLSLQYRMIQQMQFTLFDRWGNQVYTTTDMNFRWDGTLNGIPVPEGTYVYTVTGITTQGTPVQTGGTITVIR